jgi:hypothetical protein
MAAVVLAPEESLRPLQASKTANAAPGSAPQKAPELPAGLEVQTSTPRDGEDATPPVPLLQRSTPRDGKKATPPVPLPPVPSAPADAAFAASIRVEEKPLLAAGPEGTRRQPKAARAGEPESAAPPVIAAAVPPLPAPVPIKLALPALTQHIGEGTGEAPSARVSLQQISPAQPESATDLRPSAALELKLRAQDQPEQEPAAISVPRQARPAPPAERLDSSPAASPAPQARAEQTTHAIASTALPAPIEPVTAQSTQPIAVVAPVPVNLQTMITSHSNSAPATQQVPVPAPHLEEPLARPSDQHAQPLRSLSLEFTPDGAQDVRLRLAERDGDVHISLHSTDPGLTGRLGAGVHELVGTLASAGYEAQAWTQGQGRQSQGQQSQGQQSQTPPDDQRRNRRDEAADAGEEFSAMLQGPIAINP